MKKTKILSIALAAALVVGALAGCGSSNSSNGGGSAAAEELLPRVRIADSVRGGYASAADS